jgi:pimeloyl-ACP methyl ester carboxylesterase
VLLFLHGFPSSSFDWRELLARTPGAALSFDFLGFGLSEKPRDHVYTLAWQADLAVDLVEKFAHGREIQIVAHDMGTSVATELMARDIADELDMNVTRILLFNGSILLDRATPTLGQKLLRSRGGPLFARLSTKRFFKMQLGSVFSDAHPLSDGEAGDQWSLLSFENGHRIGHLLVHYMDERDCFTERWHGAIRDWPGDLSLAWGMRDPVAIRARARRPA